MFFFVSALFALFGWFGVMWFDLIWFGLVTLVWLLWFGLNVFVISRVLIRVCFA